MKVKNIHFVKSIPGMPVYEMEDKSIRLPFPDGKVKAILHLSEQEVLDSLTEPTPQNKNIIMAQFAEVRQLLGLEKKRTILKIAGNA